MAFGGLPRRVQYTPVPNPMFGTLLEQIDDLGELKCTLRLIWMLHRQRGHPKLVTLGELKADRTLARSLAHLNDRTAIERAMRLAVQRGTFLAGTDERSGETVYMLNSEQGRAAMAAAVKGHPATGESTDLEPWEAAVERPNVFAMYEDNIGMMSPMIADELREAEQLYPVAWIEDAFREAVENNKRSWRYVSRILERWSQEGRGDGEPGRYPKKVGRYY